jgi:flavodoxin
MKFLYFYQKKKMKAFVIYDSVFGNTRQIAEAIGKVLAAGAEVEVFQISEAMPERLKGLDFLVIGSPTRGFRPTPAIVKLLKDLSDNSLRGIKVAAFDTRVKLSDIKSGFFRFIVDKGGYAASTIAKQLQKKGGSLVLPPEGFFVSGEEGPLKDGELERAEKWGLTLLV